jgi:hypothetical protein
MTSMTKSLLNEGAETVVLSAHKNKLEIFNCEQGSPDWFKCRLGLVTASRFKDVMAKGDGKMREDYLYELALEQTTGEPTEGFTNPDMDRGREYEPEARDLYEFACGHQVARTGFIRNGDIGCSPDGLIGDDGLLEIKTMLPKKLIRLLGKDKSTWALPPEHRSQVQGAMLVCERAWCDFIIYWPKMPLYRVRVRREESYIRELKDQIDIFNLDLRKLVSRIKGL